MTREVRARVSSGHRPAASSWRISHMLWRWGRMGPSNGRNLPGPCRMDACVRAAADSLAVSASRAVMRLKPNPPCRSGRASWSSSGEPAGTWTVHEGVCSVQERVLKPADVVLEKGPRHCAREVVHAGLEGGAEDQEPVLCCEGEGKEGVDEAASPLGMFCQEGRDKRGSAKRRATSHHARLGVANAQLLCHLLGSYRVMSIHATLG
jgi:hypothetical protein